MSQTEFDVAEAKDSGSNWYFQITQPNNLKFYCFFHSVYTQVEKENSIDMQRGLFVKLTLSLFISNVFM